MYIQQLLLASMATICISASPLTADDGHSGKIRVGTYDSRAIAIAYAPSKFNPVRTNMEKYETAKKEGDERTMKALQSWGKKHQRQLHRQGFSNLPVHNLLMHVQDQLPKVAKDAGVAVIVSKCDFVADNVESVDLTDQIVKLYEPTEKTLKHIREIRDKKPVDIDDLSTNHEDY